MGAVIGPAAPREAARLLPPLDFLRPLTGGQAALLAEAILTGQPQPERPRPTEPAVMPGSYNGAAILLSGTTYRSHEQMRRLFDAAVDHDATVEILYRPPRGRPSLRRIEPLYADAAGVQAWDLASRQEREFELGRIEWARAVSEPVPAGPPKH